MELPAEIRSLIDGLQGRIERLEARVAELERENAALRAENADLKRRLGLDSSTSSKPPSSDGLRKKPASLRQPSGKTSGGQAGHKGDTLKRVADPDRIVLHEARACRHCGAGLTLSMAQETERRQVFDLPAKLIEVTEHQRPVYACAGCGGRTGTAFPEGVEAPAQYGERLRAAAVYLHLQQLIPEDRTAQTLADLIGVPGLCPASVMDWVRRKANALAPAAGRIGALVGAAHVRCLDETGFRVAGQTQWLHTVATESLTLYRVSDKRGDVPGNLAGGVVVHDGFKSYGALAGAAHARCNAHHLRELKALIEFDHEPWAALMRDLLLDANRAVGEAKARGERALDAALLKCFDIRFWDILREGLAFHRKLPRLPQPARGKTKRRPGENLLRRLHQFKDDVLRFLVDFDVPFTNNLAEQALRMMKVKMKISGAFRTFDAAQDFAALRSIIATARKQGWNILQTLTRDAPSLINALPT
ncbi:MAG TPA: IS66 family transposase [Roseiarcus sp.]|nr:IS66 family transposase [Roseiarcus sp.]HXJ94736.1 IS66 family transposase [Terriglobia bacterium]